MKKIVCLALLVLVSAYLFAQTPASAFSAEVKFGAAVPVGKFSNKSLNSDGQSSSSGWAKPGPALQVVFNYQLNKNYGLSLLFGGQENKESNSALKNSIQSMYGSSPTGTLVTTAKTWKIGQVLAGGFVSVPFSNSRGLSFNASARAGVLKTALPGYSYTATQYTQDGFPAIMAWAQQDAQKLPWAFCYQLSAGLRLQCAKRLYATADIQYAHAAPTFSYTRLTGFPNNPVYTPYKTKYPVASVNALVGVGYRF